MNQIFIEISGFVSLSALLSFNLISRSYDRFSRKTPDRRTTDMGQSVGPASRVGGSKNKKGYLDKVAHKKVGIKFSYVSEKC